MKQHLIKKDYAYIKILFFAIIICALFACGTVRKEEVSETDTTYVVVPEIENEDFHVPATVNEDIQKPAELNDYNVILSVDSVIYKKETGILHVWIGNPNVKVNFPAGTVQDGTVIPSNIGDYAKIIPVVPLDIEVKSVSEEKCHKIHPSGSDIRFLLIPKTAGTYKVSVNVEIYQTENCEGKHVPKVSKTLSVNVKVNTKKELVIKLQTLGDVIWGKFLSFWGALITLLFTVFLFLIRKRLKRKTGFEEQD